MHDLSTKYLRCVKCAGLLEVHVLKESSEIDEGFLYCTKCSAQFPVIGKIAIMRDFENYVSVRPRLGGIMALEAKTSQMKLFVKNTLSKIRTRQNDLSIVEERWAGIYARNKGSRFYLEVQHLVGSLAGSGNVVEHGCSVGSMAQILAQTHSRVFGIDKSYHALLLAKKSGAQNLDYFVADSLAHPFGKAKFDLVVGLNIFELIEPKPLLRTLSQQVAKGGLLALSDPYDYQRGDKSVKEPLGEDSLRAEIRKRGLQITKNTRKPARISWNLRLYDRATLQYKVDMIMARRT